MGFTRRFASRAYSDNQLAYAEEGGEEIPTLSARIEEKQKRTSCNSKVYPKGHPIERAEHEKQHTLQTKICIVLCTVLPFLTLVATIHRLWFMGVIELSNWEVTDCPDHWILWSGSCYFYMPDSQSWEEAKETCARLDNSYLVYITSDEENQFLEKMTVSRIWIGGRYSSKGWRWEPGGWGINADKIETQKQSLKTPRHRKDIFVVKDSNMTAADNEEESSSMYSEKLSTGTAPIASPTESGTVEPLTSVRSTQPSEASTFNSRTETSSIPDYLSSAQDYFISSTESSTASSVIVSILTADISSRDSSTAEFLSRGSTAEFSSADSKVTSSTAASTDSRTPASSSMLSSSSSILPTQSSPPINQTVKIQILKSEANPSQGQDPLHRKKSRLKLPSDESRVNIINVTANGKFINGTIIRKMRMAAASSDRHLDVDECLVYHRGAWYRDECNKQRGFICKISVPDSIKMGKTTCRNKYKVNAYNRDLYYICKDED